MMKDYGSAETRDETFYGYGYGYARIYARRKDNLENRYINYRYIRHYGAGF